MHKHCLCVFGNFYVLSFFILPVCKIPHHKKLDSSMNESYRHNKIQLLWMGINQLISLKFFIIMNMPIKTVLDQNTTFICTRLSWIFNFHNTLTRFSSIKKIPLIFSNYRRPKSRMCLNMLKMNVFQYLKIFNFHWLIFFLSWIYEIFCAYHLHHLACFSFRGDPNLIF